ncbi:MAG TPA: M48 family metalloprotease [Myxococcales bacterium]|jgi:predicted Zn-dependent protease
MMSARPSPSAAAAAAVAVLALGLAGCVLNPATGKEQLNLVSEAEEIQMGQQAAAQVEQEIGLYQDPKVQAYVASIGKQIAARSERPNLPWTFKVVDDATVNAFALPGGHIYVTRGLMTYLNTEAELAGVLGHEIGHVTARHSVNMISKQEVAQLGLGVAMIAKPGLQQFAGLASGGLQLLFLKFSRDDENQADHLSLGYLQRTGYQAQGLPDMLETLNREGQLGGGGRLPTWLSTHPSSADRVQKTSALIRSRGIDPKAGKVDREKLMATIDGMPFGEDPRDGYAAGNAFVVPNLKISVDLPQGWKVQNTASQMTAVSPGQDAAVQLQVAGAMPLDQAAQQIFGGGQGQQQSGLKASGPSRNATVNGLPALLTDFTGQTSQGANVQGTLELLSHGGKTFALLAYAAQSAGQYPTELSRVLSSFRPETDSARLSVQPARVQVTKVAQAETLQQFNAAQPSSIDLPHLAVINQAQPQERLAPGELVKRVVGGPGTTRPG